MKKFFAIFLVFSFLILSGCLKPADKILNSIGTYNLREYYTSDGFQDYTDYAKYSYEEVDFSSNRYFTKVSSDNMQMLTSHIENFEEWVEAIGTQDTKSEVVQGYDFDISVVSEGDYFYIYDDPDYPEFGNYDVYYFDIDTMMLYYFHNNI